MRAKNGKTRRKLKGRFEIIVIIIKTQIERVEKEPKDRRRLQSREENRKGRRDRLITRPNGGYKLILPQQDSEKRQVVPRTESFF